MKFDINIELATVDDVHRIIDICSKGYAFTTKQFNNQLKAKEAIRKYYNVSRIRNEIVHTNTSWNGWVLARREREVVGAAGGGLVTENTGMLFVIYLDLTVRRRGVGTKLVTFVTERQKDLGATKQLVRVLKSNSQAISFYQSLGFVYREENVDQEDIEYTSIIMERDI